MNEPKNNLMPFDGNPLATFALFTYNQEKYIQEAVEGALAQNYTPLEIIISDDCSTDSTFSVIEACLEKYTGHARIILNKNENNLGILHHVNKVLDMASGEFIVMAAGDDISHPDRTTTLIDAWKISGKKDGAIFTNAIIIDEFGESLGAFYNNPEPVLNLQSFIKYKRCWAGGFSLGFSSYIHKKYGAISSETFQEDGAIAFRAILNSGIIYLEKKTVSYRRHGSNTYDTANYKKYFKLVNSEKELAKCRMRDLAMDKQISHQDRMAINKILMRDIYIKSMLANFPFLIRVIMVKRKLMLYLGALFK